MTCQGCECKVPLRNGMHEEPTDVPGTVYVYPCTVPRRIQRRRVKGWRLPAGTVCVTRPGKWGNPFRLVHPSGGEWVVMSPWETLVEYGSREKCTAYAVEHFEKTLRAGQLAITVADVRRELRGKDLACWCPPGSPCHADVLLRIAAEGQS